MAKRKVLTVAIQEQLQSAVPAAPAAPVTRTVEQQVQELFGIAQQVHAIVNVSVVAFDAVKTASETANAAINAARVGHLQSLQAICAQIAEPVTVAIWDEKYASAVYQALLDSKRFGDTLDAVKKLRQTTVALEKLAVVALTHKSHMGQSLAPLAGESLRTYVDRVRPIMVMSDDKTPAIWQAKAGKQVAAAKVDANTGKIVPAAPSAPTAAARTNALKILCNGDLSDMQMLDEVTKDMPRFRAMYAIMYPIKK
jgi:hypothetical protein